MPNYDPKGLRVRDRLFHSGLEPDVFVNLNNKCRPYIFMGKPTSNGAHRDFVEIGYVTNGLHEVEVYSDPNRRLADHLDDPLYDPTRVDENTPHHQIADMDLVTQARLRGVGD